MKKCENNSTALAKNVTDRENELAKERKRIKELEAEMKEMEAAYKELSESRQFIAAIVTPLCLFGVLALAFVVYSCAKEPRQYTKRAREIVGVHTLGFTFDDGNN